MENLGSGRVVVRLLTLGYTAAFSGMGFGARGRAGICRSLPVWFTSTMGTLWTPGGATLPKLTS